MKTAEGSIKTFQCNLGYLLNTNPSLSIIERVDSCTMNESSLSYSSCQAEIS